MNWLVPRKSLFWRKTGSTLSRVFKTARGLFPLTWLSIVLAVLVYYVWYWEVSAHANQILYTVVLLWLLVWAVLLVFSLLSVALVWLVTRSHNRDNAIACKNEVGGHITSDYAVFCPFFLPFVEVNVEMVQTSIKRHAQRHAIWETEWLEPVGRGRFAELRRRITVRDIFGLTSITFEMCQNADIEISPASGQFEMKAFQTRTTGDGYSHPEGDPKGELVEMRRYQAGDPLKLILWKVFARSRKLVVRAPEPAIVEQNDMFVYFVSGRDDEASAAVARAFLASFGKDDGDMCFAADGANRIASDQKEGISDVIDSVNHREHGGEDLLAVAPLVSPATMQNCFLLVPQRMGAWIDVVRKFVAQYQVRPVFIMSVNGDEGRVAASKPSRLKRILLRADETEKKQDDRDTICRKLSDLGTVRIVDIATGASRDWQA